MVIIVTNNTNHSEIKKVWVANEYFGFLQTDVQFLEQVEKKLVDSEIFFQHFFLPNVPCKIRDSSLLPIVWVR